MFVFTLLGMILGVVLSYMPALFGAAMMTDDPRSSGLSLMMKVLVAFLVVEMMGAVIGGLLGYLVDWCVFL